MNLGAFQTLRSGLRRNAAPVTAQVRKVLQSGLEQELLHAGVFEEVEVGSCDDEEHLLVALCSYLGEVRDEDVVAAVEAAWAAVAFHHWSAHAFLTEDGHVELQAAALDRPGGRFVSLHLVAQRVTAPAAALVELPAPAAVADQDVLAAPLPAQQGPAPVVLAHTA